MSTKDSEQQREFATTGPIRAAVRLPSGELEVIATDTDVVTVAVRPDGSEGSRQAAAATTIEFTDGRLRVETPDHGGGWLFKRGAQVRVELRLPTDSDLRFSTGSGDLRTEGRLREVEVSTGSGDAVV